ncbi:hypothetical protein BLOT_005440, partial [Blomia tropicalis]
FDWHNSNKCLNIRLAPLMVMLILGTKPCAIQLVTHGFYTNSGRHYEMMHRHRDVEGDMAPILLPLRPIGHT